MIGEKLTDPAIGDQILCVELAIVEWHEPFLFCRVRDARRLQYLPVWRSDRTEPVVKLLICPLVRDAMDRDNAVRRLCWPKSNNFLKHADLLCVAQQADVIMLRHLRGGQGCTVNGHLVDLAREQRAVSGCGANHRGQRRRNGACERGCSALHAVDVHASGRAVVHSHYMDPRLCGGADIESSLSMRCAVANDEVERCVGTPEQL